MSAEPPEQPGPMIQMTPEQAAGVYSNFARVSHSVYEFTIDFSHLDLASEPVQGIVVARVAMSPLMVSQLIEALQTNWAKYAEYQMPPEVRNDGRTPGDEDGPATPSSAL